MHIVIRRSAINATPNATRKPERRTERPAIGKSGRRTYHTSTGRVSATAFLPPRTAARVHQMPLQGHQGHRRSQASRQRHQRSSRVAMHHVEAQCISRIHRCILSSSTEQVPVRVDRVSQDKRGDFVAISPHMRNEYRRASSPPAKLVIPVYIATALPPPVGRFSLIGYTASW